MRSIVNASLALAVNWLAIKRTVPSWIPEGDLDAWRRDLARARLRARRALDPADPAHVLDALEQLASAFQVSIPDQQGIKVYVATLQTVGVYALTQAVREVALHHKWPRLPYPAEILEHAASPQRLLTLWAERIERAIGVLG